MPILTCGFIGLGLIGGSLAKAMKAYNPDIRILAYDINENSLKLAFYVHLFRRMIKIYLHSRIFFLLTVF